MAPITETRGAAINEHMQKVKEHEEKFRHIRKQYLKDLSTEHGQKRASRIPPKQSKNPNRSGIGIHQPSQRKQGNRTGSYQIMADFRSTK